jgi:hypothetical protein
MFTKKKRRSNLIYPEMFLSKHVEKNILLKSFCNTLCPDFLSVSVQSEWEMKRAIMQRTRMLVYVPHNVFVMTSATDAFVIS